MLCKVLVLLLFATTLESLTRIMTRASSSLRLVGILPIYI